MVCMSLLKCRRCQTNVHLFICGSLHLSFIDDVGDRAFAREWALALFLTVTSGGLAWIALFENCIIVAFYNRLHVWHTAITEFQRVAVADLSQYMALWEMILYQLQEFPSNFCFQVLAERGRVPSHFTRAFLPSGGVSIGRSRGIH